MTESVEPQRDLTSPTPLTMREISEAVAQGKIGDFDDKSLLEAARTVTKARALAGNSEAPEDAMLVDTRNAIWSERGRRAASVTAERAPPEPAGSHGVRTSTESPTTDRKFADLTGEGAIEASERIASAVLRELDTAVPDTLLAPYAAARLSEQLNWSPGRISEVTRDLCLPGEPASTKPISHAERPHADINGDDGVAASKRIAEAVMKELDTAPPTRLLANYVQRRLGEQLNWSPERLRDVVQALGCRTGVGVHLAMARAGVGM